MPDGREEPAVLVVFTGDCHLLAGGGLVRNGAGSGVRPG